MIQRLADMMSQRSKNVFFRKCDNKVEGNPKIETHVRDDIFGMLEMKYKYQFNV